ARPPARRWAPRKFAPGPLSRGHAALPALSGGRGQGDRCDSRPEAGARVRPARDRARAGSGAGRRPPRHAALAGGDAMSLSVGGTRHLQALLGSLGRLARSPLSTFLTLLVIALALALPTSLRLLVTNAQLATGNFANAVDVSVYLKTDVPLAKAQQLAQATGQRADVVAVTVIAADKGLEDFRTYSGFGEALQALKENPLPHVLHVFPKATDSSAAALESLRRYFSAWPEVDLVQADSEWVMRFNAILEVMRRLLLIAAALLGLGVLAV